MCHITYIYLYNYDIWYMIWSEHLFFIGAGQTTHYAVGHFRHPCLLITHLLLLLLLLLLRLCLSLWWGLRLRLSDLFLGLQFEGNSLFIAPLPWFQVALRHSHHILTTLLMTHSVPIRNYCRHSAIYFDVGHQELSQATLDKRVVGIEHG